MCTDIFQTRMSWLTCLFWHSTTMFKDILQTRMPRLHLKTSSRQGCHDQHVYFDTPQLHLKMIFQTRMSWLTCLFWHSTTTFKDDLPDKDVMSNILILILHCHSYRVPPDKDVLISMLILQLMFVMCMHRPLDKDVATSMLVLKLHN